MPSFLAEPWPWYVAGPVLGLVVPLLLVLGNRDFGVSSNLRHLCSASRLGGCDYFSYDWRRQGGWNLLFLAGILVGGGLAAWITVPETVAISPGTRAQLQELGIQDLTGLAPPEVFSWDRLGSAPTLTVLLLGGFAIGFGTAWAGGCTSGHAITGIANLQIASIVATLGFMVGGFASTWLILPRLLGGGP